MKPELLIASATVLAVTNELPLPTGAPTLPSVDGVKVVVTAAIWLLPLMVVVVPSTSTLYLTVVTPPASVSTIAVVAVPLANFTLSPGVTTPLVAPALSTTLKPWLI